MVLYASFDFERQSRIISLRLQKIPQNIFLVETEKLYYQHCLFSYYIFFKVIGLIFISKN